MRQSDVAAATRALLARERVPARRRVSHGKDRKLTHLGKRGEARMVDVSDKAATERDRRRRGPRRDAARRRSSSCSTATPRRATCSAPRASPASWRPSGRIELIPLCHPLPITKVAVDIEPDHALPGFVRAGDRQGHRPDRRRDGGADRRLGRVPHDLRHGQGGRARHADRRHPPARKAAAASPATTAPTIRRVQGVAWRRCCRSPTRSPACSTASSRCRAKTRR